MDPLATVEQVFSLFNGLDYVHDTEASVKGLEPGGASRVST